MIRSAGFAMLGTLVSTPALAELRFPPIEVFEGYFEAGYSRGGPQRSGQFAISVAQAETLEFVLAIGMDVERAEQESGEPTAREREITAELHWNSFEFNDRLSLGFELEGKWLRAAEGVNDGPDDHSEAEEALAGEDDEADGEEPLAGTDTAQGDSNFARSYDRASGMQLGAVLHFELSDALAVEAQIFQERLHDEGSKLVANGLTAGIAYQLTPAIETSAEATRLRERGVPTEYVLALAFDATEELAFTVEAGFQKGSSDTLSLNVIWQLF